jgi:hypothetical protein
VSTEKTDLPLPRWLWILGLIAFVGGWMWLHDNRGDNRTGRVPMALTGAGLIVLRGVLAGLWRRRVSVVIVLWSLIVIGAMVGRPIERIVKKGAVSDWSFFHYYLGAKYFTELGYDGLYEQAILADHENKQHWKKLQYIRNLYTYAFEPPAAETRVRGEAWTEARWQEFSDDVEHFYPELRRRWEEVLTDRGYNATPTWNTSGWILSHLPATKWGLAIYGSVDAFLLLGAFGFFVWTFGPVWGLLAAAWCLLFYGNQGHVIGRPFLHSYLVALLVFAAAVHRKQARLAGVALAYAAMVRIFPGFFLGGLGVWTLLRWFKTRQIPTFTRQFAPAFLLTCTLLVGYGAINGRGMGAWTEFLNNISMHSDDHRFGGRRIGLQHFYTHDMSKGFEFTAKYRRRNAWKKQETLWAVSAGVMCLLWLGAMLKINDNDPLDAMLLSMAVVFAVIVLSRYYWGAGALFFVLGARGRDGPYRGIVAALLFVQIAIFYVMKGLGDATFPWFVVANLTWILWFVFVLGGRLAAPRAVVPPVELDVDKPDIVEPELEQPEVAEVSPPPAPALPHTP